MPTSTENAVLAASGVAVRENGELLFDALTVTAAPGELVSLVAPPGAARMSALLALGGRLKLAAGTVTADAAIGWLPGLRLFEDRATVREVLRQGRALAKADTTAVDEDLALLGLDDHGDRTAEDLPQLAKALLGAVAVARQRKPVLLLDLPPGSPMFVEAASRVIASVRESGVAVVAASDRPVDGSDRVVELNDPFESARPAPSHENKEDRR